MKPLGLDGLTRWGILLLSLHSNTQALRLPLFWSSHMVLQRNNATIWGWSDDAVVTLQLDDQPPLAIPTNGFGVWSAQLHEPASTNRTIVLWDALDTVELYDVDFGDVFFCSGQSNMEMAVVDSPENPHTIEQADEYPDLRYATVGRVLSYDEQADTVSKAPYVWKAGSKAFSNRSFSYISATCYYFGRSAYLEQNATVPVGLVVSAWGGQRIETFSSKRALERCPNPPNELESIENSQIWNAMIAPFRRMRFSAMLWYQGEANRDDPVSYACRFPEMIKDWRNRFQSPNLPFLYVQLAPYKDDQMPRIRAAQQSALQLENVHQVVTMDLGDPTSPFGSIHSRLKSQVGQRLFSAWVGGPESIEPDDPVFEDRQVSLLFPRKVRFASAHGCSACCEESPFEVLRGDQWERMPAASVPDRKERASVIIPTDYLAEGVRYNWEGFPQCVLLDEHGLPVRPFQHCRNQRWNWLPDPCPRQSIVDEGSLVGRIG